MYANKACFVRVECETHTLCSKKLDHQSHSGGNFVKS